LIPRNDEHTGAQVRHSDLLTDIAIGMSDGLTVPFALSAGLSSAFSPHLIIIAGIVEVAAGSIAMGLGGYFAGRAEMDFYNSDSKREYGEVEIVTRKEKEEVKAFFQNLGLSEDVQEQAVEELTKNQEAWANFRMKHEAPPIKSDSRRARKSAFNIGFSYIIGGFIPLSPYFFVDDGLIGLRISSIITLISLFIFGFLKSKLTGAHPWWGAMRITFIGAAAAACAFGIARIIQNA